jgi:hypothetical protein
MDLSEEHLLNIKRQIVEIIASGLEDNKITEDEFVTLSDFVIEKVANVKTHDDLLVFLRELTHRWTMFSFLLKIEDGMVKRIEDQKKAEQITELTKLGQYDEALNIVNNDSNNA